MTSQQQHLENLSEIRNIMERSSRFISLSGLSGIFIGSTALVGAAIAVWLIGFSEFYFTDYSRVFPAENSVNYNLLYLLFVDAFIVLILSIGFGIYFTTRKARKRGLPTWDSTARRLVINLLIPLAAGGVFCYILLYHGVLQLIAPATLIFYGLALINASKYTLNDIRYLGLIEIMIGLIAAFYARHGLVLWVIGFGVMHIIYGAVMYWKYER